MSIDKEKSNFYLQNSIVLSLPQVIPWWMVWLKKDILTAEVYWKINRKIYLWFSKKGSKSRLGDFVYCNISKWTIEKMKVNDLYGSSSAKKLNHLILKYAWIYSVDFGEINFFSEFRRGQWSLFTSSFFILLSALFIYLKDEKTNFRFPTVDLIKRIAELSFRMRKEVGLLWNDSWFHVYASLKETCFPVANLWATCINDMWSNISVNYIKSNIREFKWVFNEVQYLWFEFFIIDWWGKLPKNSTISSKYEDFEWLDDYFSKNLLGQIYDTFWKDDDILNQKYLKLFYLLNQYISSPSKKNLNRLFWISHKVFLQHMSNDVMTSFGIEFHQKLSQEIWWVERFWTLPLTTLDWYWRILIIVESWVVVQRLEKICKEINLSLWTHLYVDYDSSQENVDEEWIKIEQDLGSWLYSDYLNKNSVLFYDDAGFKKPVKMKDIIKESSSDILLDGISKKIYCLWEKLSSKDIQSQSATVDILLKLINSPWRDVFNTEFPRSSYSKNKNEMISKIILPLQNYLRNKLSRELPISCHGWLYEFTVSLDEAKNSISIGFISKPGSHILP